MLTALPESHSPLGQHIGLSYQRMQLIYYAVHIVARYEVVIGLLNHLVPHGQPILLYPVNGSICTKTAI